MDTPNPNWPALPYGPWRETCATLHLWTQIVGKVRLARTPWLNHGWHVPLYVSVNGLSTSLISCGSRSLEIRFNFREHLLEIDTSDGAGRRLPLRAQSVASFYSHEVSSAGFWPGSEANPDPCFYSYAYPEPPGYRDFAVRPSHASFSEQLGEYVLLYDRVRESHNPETMLLSFLQSSYEAAADNANWDRNALERPLGTLGFPSQWLL